VHATREEERRVGLSLEIAAVAFALVAALVSLLLIGDEQWWTIWLLFVPVAVAGFPLVLAEGRPRQVARIVAAILLVAWCLIALASVGLFYLLSAAVMVTAAIRGRGS
jgi:hypothetical protein